MDMKHFGDSYDIVKQSLLGWLRPFGDWSVHPMFTGDLRPGDVEAFERFLGAKVLSREVLKSDTDRLGYFSCVQSCHNLFLDPTTGLRLEPTGRKAPNYLFGNELVGIAKRRPTALMLVFDQSLPRGSEKAALRKKLNHLLEQDIDTFAYCSHACFILACHDSKLVNQVYDHVIAESGLPEDRFLRITHAPRAAHG